MTLPVRSAHAQTATKLGWSSVIVRTGGANTFVQARDLHRLGASITQSLPLIHALTVRVPTGNLKHLASLPWVRHVSPDMAVRKFDEFAVESSVATGVAAKYGVTGANVGVAVLDSGIRDGNDFGPTSDGKDDGGDQGNKGSRVLASVNFVPDAKGKVNANDTDDACGHGTHVAGIVAGNGANSSDKKCFRTFTGIATGANLINVRVLDANGGSSVSQVIAGLQWVVNNKAKYNIRVVNLSLGHPVGESYVTDPLCLAVEQVWKSGIVVVVAAGNAGRLQDTALPLIGNEGYGTAYGSIQSPGNDPFVITVGAMKATDMVFNADGTWTHNRANDRIATYSSRGPSRLDLVMKPDIVAPGNKIISTLANNTTLDNYAGGTNDIPQITYIQKGGSNKTSSDYFQLSGTSMATPVVAGAAALLLSQNPNLTPDTIKARLMLSADKWVRPDGIGDPCTFGAGYLNVAAALQSRAVANQFALSPALTANSDGSVAINMDRALWGVDTATGTRAVWGVSGVNDLRAIWGTQAIWGVNTLGASRAIWGNSVWSDRAIWGNSYSSVDLSSVAINGEK